MVHVCIAGIELLRGQIVTSLLVNINLLIPPLLFVSSESAVQDNPNNSRAYNYLQERLTLLRLEQHCRWRTVRLPLQLRRHRLISLTPRGIRRSLLLSSVKSIVWLRY
jgi:hypothetical protein